MRAVLLALIALLGLAGAARAGDGSAADPFRVAMVLWRGETEVEAGFRAFMADAGVAVEVTAFDVARDRDAIPGVVERVRALRPDLVYTWGTSVTLGVVGPFDDVDPTRHITDIPAIFTLVADPIGARIVPDFASSGRNLTGTAFLAPVEAQLRAIAEYAPFDRLAVVYNPQERNSVLNVEALARHAEAFGYRLIRKAAPLDADGKPDGSAVPRLVAEAAREGADVLYIGPDSFTAVHGEALTQTAIAHRLPTFAATERPLRQASAMMGLVSNYFALGRFVGFKALKVLRGEVAPVDEPIESLARFSFVLNIGVATRIGAYPPLGVLKYAELIGRAEE